MSASNLWKYDNYPWWPQNNPECYYFMLTISRKAHGRSSNIKINWPKTTPKFPLELQVFLQDCISKCLTPKCTWWPENDLHCFWHSTVMLQSKFVYSPAYSYKVISNCLHQELQLRHSPSLTLFVSHLGTVCFSGWFYVWHVYIFWLACLKGRS